MRTKDIKFVKRLERNGMTYGWFVASRNTATAQSREYINYENGKTCVKPYPVENLPKYVKAFIDNHAESLFESIGDEFNQYIIK